MKRLGIAPDARFGVLASKCGFEPYERDDGLHPAPSRPRPVYDEYLRRLGFESGIRWEEWANSGGSAEDLMNGWLLAYADKPARIPEEHFETRYMTRRAMDFIRQAGTDGRPWCLHPSYIKPHWPYIVPAPYHDMYGRGDLVPVVRHDVERADPHPVFAALQQFRVSRNCSRDEVRAQVLPAYMGLIRQINDQIGVLMRFLEERGELGSMMVWCSPPTAATTWATTGWARRTCSTSARCAFR